VQVEKIAKINMLQKAILWLAPLGGPSHDNIKLIIAWKTHG